MSTVLYLWVLGVALVALGGAVAARGWWLDKAAGNYKRARCRRCWYSLEGTGAKEDGSTVCPECGVVARRARDLHRVKRNLWVTLAGVVMVAGGVYLCGRPVLDGGRWLYLLPRDVAARLWSWAGAEGYGRDIRARMAQGTATDAEIESVTGGAKKLVLRAAKTGMNGTGITAQDIAVAFTALAKQGPDPEVERAAGALMVENMPFLSQPAVKYLVAMGVPMERRIEMAEAALAAKKGSAFPQEYLRMLSEATDDPAAMAALVRMASGPRTSQLTSWARNSLMGAREQGVQAVMAAFKEAKTGTERARLFEVFGQVAPYSMGPAMKPFLIEALAFSELRMGAAEFVSMHGRELEISEEDVRGLIMSEDADRVALGLKLVEMQLRLPEGCGEKVLAMIDAGRNDVPRQVVYRFQGRDRALWVARLNGGTPGSRRDACLVLASYGAGVPGSVEALRKIEADSGESEEMRVSARDALKQMGMWRP